MNAPAIRALAAAAVVLAAACTDTPTGVPASPPAGAASAASPRAGLVANSVKYRDQGGHPARGRSGSAAVDALALLARDGTTTLHLSAHHVTDPGRTGFIKRAQVKAFDSAGTHKFTRNLAAPTPATEFGGLVRGERVQVQALVTGLDAPRTGVVTVTETVKRLPDLRVRISAPDSAKAGAPVNVLAIVREHNGDMGTRAECALYVGGERVDQASGIWVDAGDEVTCALTWASAIVGTWPLEVRVSSAGPDWDPANNADTTHIRVVANPPFMTEAYFVEQSYGEEMQLDSWWQNEQTGTAGASHDGWRSSRTDQTAMMSGYLPLAVAGPVDVRVSMAAASQTVHRAEWPGIGDGASDWCMSRAEGMTLFSMCSYTSGGTNFTYSLVAGAVTYYGSGYTTSWDLATGATIYYYSWNTEESSGALVPDGWGWIFDVRLDTPAGQYVAVDTLDRMTSFYDTWHYYPSCSSYSYPDGLNATYCSMGTAWLIDNFYF